MFFIIWLPNIAAPYPLQRLSSLLWTSDQPDAETDNTQHSHKADIHDPPGFEPASQ